MQYLIDTGLKLNAVMDILFPREMLISQSISTFESNDLSNVTLINLKL